MRMKAQTMPRVGLGGALTVILAGAGAVALWLQADPEPSRTESAPAWHQAGAPTQHGAVEEREALKAEIARLKAGKEGVEQLSGKVSGELSALRSRLTQVDRNQATMDQKLAKLGRVGSAGGPEADTPALTPEEERDKANARIQAQVAVLEGTVRAERPDPQWAATAQAALQRAFQTTAMGGLQFSNAECGATLCRMELASNGVVSPEESFRNLAHLAPWPGQGFARVDSESGKAVVYLAREGHALPQAGP